MSSSICLKRVTFINKVYPCSELIKEEIFDPINSSIQLFT